MLELSLTTQSLWAKKNRVGEMLWLPLSVHLSDSALLAQKLWNCWLPDGVKQAISSSIVGAVDAEQLFIFLAAAHDIGKATPVFQAKRTVFPTSDLDECLDEQQRLAGLPMRPLREFASQNSTPHALATQILLEEAGCNRNIAVILGTHHGKPPSSNMLNNCGVRTYGENYHLGKDGKTVWTSVQIELMKYALSLADFSDFKDIPQPYLVAQTLLSGLVIMTDWIASNEWFFPYYQIDGCQSFKSVKERVRTAWTRLGFQSPWNAGKGWMGTNLYRRRFNFQPNALQNAVALTAGKVETPGILVLEAPMGAGKTEAALVAAEIFADKAKRSGVFFALPTQATSDGIFPRMLDWVRNLDEDGKHSFELAHGKAQFNADFQALKFLIGSTNIGENEDGGVAVVHSWFEGQKKALLADFVVGTIDQLLLAALKQKHVMLRHLGLANKVVIIDECHAYDAYMSQYLDMALRWLGVCHVPVIVLSATLPAQKRQMVIEAYLNSNSSTKLQNDPLGRSITVPEATPEWVLCRDYPLITWTDGSKVLQQAVLTDAAPREVRLDCVADSDLLDKLEDLLTDGGCAGVIVNTVKRSQELAQALRLRFGTDIVKLLHSRFLALDRAKKERELLSELGKPVAGRQRPPKRIIVGTQVLEQSLDIDFDVLVTDICPMDLLLQRIGRLHRHERIRPEKLHEAVCYIIGLDGDAFMDGTTQIYEKYLLLRTKALLPSCLTIPCDVPKLVQEVYDESTNPSPEPAGYREAQEAWKKNILDKEKRAGDFRVSQPWPGPEANLVGWLDTDISDKSGEAAVRDTDESIEVLLIQEKNDGTLRFLPWIEDGHELLPNTTPDDKLAKALACQRIRLPRVLCAPWAIGRTIEELERLNVEYLSQWQQSPWLKGELFLILGDNGSATLCGYRLSYNQENGLLCEKEDGV